tara:strand:- start:12635 stop:12775 length:141 start_codon:yes stop_codon:yes gene_type:complete
MGIINDIRKIEERKAEREKKAVAAKAAPKKAKAAPKKAPAKKKKEE